MDSVTVGYIGIALFLMLIVLRVPIAFAFGTVGFLGIAMLKGAGVAASMVGSQPFAWASHYILMAIPLFILMGFFAFHAKISEDLYKCAYTCLGHIPGGLAVATIIGCAGFAATSGASLACSGAMGAVAIPEMEKHGYDKRLSTGCVAAGGTLGILIPPSIAMIIYGTICEESIGKLFIAGIVPGILLTLAYIVAVMIWIALNPKMGPPGPRFSWKERIVSLKGLGLMAALFVILIGGIFLGVFTPTEGAAVGAFGAFLFAALRKRITRRVVIDSVREAAELRGPLVERPHDALPDGEVVLGEVELRLPHLREQHLVGIRQLDDALSDRELDERARHALHASRTVRWYARATPATLFEEWIRCA